MFKSNKFFIDLNIKFIFFIFENFMFCNSKISINENEFDSHIINHKNKIIINKDF